MTGPEPPLLAAGGYCPRCDTVLTQVIGGWECMSCGFFSMKPDPKTAHPGGGMTPDFAYNRDRAPFRCEACGATIIGHNSAAGHEYRCHDSAQTCWPVTPPPEG
jgi:hypothetical protein